ncbi:hypothetical protein WMZ97_03480 [Lentibacillus sp. N15]|uniref:hypothetical protein n=1 Tax=Lentibacillus songyuanensis TaxID=3136161 RepID=UPI0031B9BFEF
MMKILQKGPILLFILSIILIVSACQNNNDEAIGADELNNGQNVNVNDHNQSHLNDPDIIPSEISDKTHTTNREGTTYSGMGNSIYGSIGSSGIHEGGVSSYFESILKGQGITGVKVFVIDDSVVLARNTAETTSHEYDNMQNDLLSANRGMSGHGEPEGIKNTKEKSYDNLDQAKEEMNDMFNGNVKILTVTDSKAVDLIERIKKNIKSSSYSSASNDVLTLLNMAK